MRAALIALMLMIGSSAGAESEVSGMLACNPNKTGEKPVLYGFDGKYLLRDNQKKTPFMHIASLAGFLEIYFAFVPTDELNERMREAANYNRMLDMLKEDMRSRLDGPEGEKYLAAFNDFRGWCEYYTNRLSETYSEFSRSLETAEYHEYLSKKFVDLSHGMSEPLRCYHVEGKKLTDFIQYSSKIDHPDGYPEVPLEDFNIDEMYQVKLTINLKEMSVLEELHRPNPIDFMQYRFEGKHFQCQSLGIDVPEIDVSESITPIGKGI